MRIAETTTIPKLAKASGMNSRTLFRRLMALHAQGIGEWMYRGKKNIRINVEALRAAHPSVFPPADLSGRVEDLEDRMGECEHENTASRRAIGNLAQEHRNHAQRLEALERRAS